MSARQACGRVDVWTSPSCVTPGRGFVNPGIMRKLGAMCGKNLLFQSLERPQRSTRVHITRTRLYDKETFTKYAYYPCSYRGRTCGRRVDVCGRPQPKNTDLSPLPRCVNPGNTRNSPCRRATPHNSSVHTSTVHTGQEGTR